MCIRDRMNNILYRGRYDELSAHVASGLNVQKAFSDYSPDDLVNCDTFLAVDQILIKWIVERLLAEDVGAALDGLTIPQICDKRSKMHFGEKTGGCYQMLDSAYQIIQAGNYRCPDSFKEILRQYQEEGNVSRPHFSRKKRDFQCLVTPLINFLVSPLWR